MAQLTRPSAEVSKTTTFIDCSRDLIRQIRSIDLRPYETGGRAGVDPDLMNLTLTLHDEAAVLFRMVADEFDESTEDGDSELQAIADLAFMANVELQQPREILIQARTAESSWEVVSRANKLLRGTVKALIALEHVLCTRAGVEPEHWLEVDTESTIKIRNAYARFHRLMIEEGENEEETQRLHVAMNLIAELLGCDGARSMRLADRSQLGRFQQAIVAWSAGFSSDPGDAIDLWHNILAFSHLMMEINHRDELIEHDRRILAEAIDLMFGESSSPEKVLEALDHLATIRGRDPLIDRLLDRESIGALKEWKRPLKELLVRISGGGEPS